LLIDWPDVDSEIRSRLLHCARVTPLDIQKVPVAVACERVIFSIHGLGLSPKQLLNSNSVDKRGIVIWRSRATNALGDRPPLQQVIRRRLEHFDTGRQSLTSKLPKPRNAEETHVLFGHFTLFLDVAGAATGPTAKGSEPVAPEPPTRLGVPSQSRRRARAALLNSQRFWSRSKEFFARHHGIQLFKANLADVGIDNVVECDATLPQLTRRAAKRGADSETASQARIASCAPIYE